MSCSARIWICVEIVEKEYTVKSPVKFGNILIYIFVLIVSI